MTVNRRTFVGGVAASAAFGPAFARPSAPDVIVYDGRVATMDPRRPEAQAIAIHGGRISAVGRNRDVMALAGPETQRIDARRRRVIPGLNDSHTHLIRGGLHYNLELRWDGVPSLALAMEMLRDQARRTPAPMWVQVIGGFSEHQFAEKRLPTLEEINAATGDTPCLIFNVYDRAFLNRAALRTIGWTRDYQPPPGGFIERRTDGTPNGVIIAKPGPRFMLQVLALAPRLSFQDELNSTRHFMREYNRLGVTSVGDAGGGFQRFPDDYRVIEELHRRNELTVRIAYSLVPQERGRELADIVGWTRTHAIGGSDMYSLMGAGENLIVSAADFENFVEPRPELADTMEDELERAARTLVAAQWPFRIHATYDESITRFLNVFERVNRDLPLSQQRWILDHCETISPRNIDRVAALNGTIAVQHRMAFVGEQFTARYGQGAAAEAPPLRRILRAGIPMPAGSDGTRASGYNPWITLHWLISGQTLGGQVMYPRSNRLSRSEALAQCTREASHVSGEYGKKGALAVGQLADLAILSDDFFSVPADRVSRLESVLTMVGGKVVYAADDFKALDPPAPAVSPDWSPVARYGGFWKDGRLLRRPMETPAKRLIYGFRESQARAGAVLRQTHTTLCRDAARWICAEVKVASARPILPCICAFV